MEPVEPSDTATPAGKAAAPQLPPLIVGVGGSAGALRAMMSLLESLGDDVPASIIFVPHLSPHDESSAPEILQRVSRLTVTQVKVREPLQAGRVYVLAPGTDLITDDGHVQPAESTNKRPSTVIDLFFRSLGRVHCERAVGVVLSGTGRDGALGLAQIKESGGLTIAQAPEDCEYSDMPRAALGTGSIDLVLSASEIGRRLRLLARFPHRARLSAVAESAQTAESGEPEAGDESEQRAYSDVLAALRVRTRHDFRHYKRGTLTRRLERRMQVNGVTSIQAYRDFVRRNPEELAPLLSDMLISVTNFFRDPEAFAALEQEVIPQLMERGLEEEELRVWIPACASGEEAYSVAILLREYADRMHHPRRVQVFASDINEDALNTARAGVYPANIVADISESRLHAYFEKGDDDHYRVRSTVREMIVFARHNVLGDPPFSRLDLICCRNLLIYLDRTAQAAALEMFAYSLKPGGYLFLGNAESIEASSAPFHFINKIHRLYRLRPEGVTRPRIPSLISFTNAAAPSTTLPVQRDFHAVPDQQPVTLLHQRAVAAAAPPNVLINAEFDIERVSPGAGRFVAFGEGVPTRSLLNNVAADIRTELRTALYRAGESRQPVRTVFRRDRPGEQEGGSMALTVHPVESGEGEPPHWLVLFEEPVEAVDAVESGAGSDAAVQSALKRLEDENRSLKAHLQETLDRSAVSNEELKASNEELQAINEELRSAKEELETSKEELQSVNEELTTVNFELRLKVDEAIRNYDDLRNLIEASEIATVFVDSAMRVKRFTPQASRLFALIPSDIGRPLLDVKSRLHYDEILEDASAAFNQLRAVERSVSTIDGEHYFLRVLPYRTSQDKIGGAVLTFINVTELRRAEERMRAAEERLRDAIAASADFAVMSTDAAGVVISWNEGARRLFGYESGAILGQPIDRLYTREDRAAGAPEEERRVALADGRAADERWYLRADGTRFFCSGVMTPLHGGSEPGFLKIARDISVAKEHEQQQGIDLTDERLANAQLKVAGEVRDRFLAVMSHELKQPLNLIQVNAELLVRLPETRQLPAAQRIGDTIKRAVRAQETIVNDMLDLSRVRTGKLRLYREQVDIKTLVERLTQTVEPEVSRKEIELTADLPPQPVICDVDPVRIEQVIWNLLGNAVKFTPLQGRIRIGLSVDHSDARLEVTDSGIGIAPSSLRTIFELFGQDESGYASAQRRVGLGIGLALVRELAEAHGGHVDALSAGPGLGASFIVWLPLARQSGASPEPAHPTFDGYSGRHILIVDDDADSLSALATILQMEGAVVETAGNGDEVLHKLGAGHYDLLLSDIGMDGMSGIELIRAVRQLPQGADLLAIAITGFGRDTDVQSALEAGFDAHVAKPVSIERLQLVLERRWNA